MFELNATSDATAFTDQFREIGRTQVTPLLSEASAKALHNLIEVQEEWNANFDRRGENINLDDSALEAMTDVQTTTLLGHLNETASHGFQYFFSAIPLYDLYHSDAPIQPELKAAYEFINGEAFLAHCRTITGFEDISFADAQVTRYGPGHFLTRHDDNVAGKNRRAAYVFNLTPEWRTEWGGMLEFHDDAGNIEAALKPAFNALNLFRVPQTHAVSYVTPFARAYRYAITGWLRAGEDPKGA